LAGDAYRTRLARGEAAVPDDKTRIAQEGYQSRLARDAAGGLPDTGEFYKVGEKIGDRFEVSAIHHGELGVVYGCFDHKTKLPRALKTVRARHASDKQVLSLFENEAAIWVSLGKHPYIVRAYLVERFKNLPYVITEYIRGPEGMEGDLRGWLGHPRLTLPVAVAMALQVAQGMQHAVRKVPNLVHRDLKPANILVNGDGKAMVTDFGLVHAAQSGAGTPAYMSPEQWRAEALDARSDIYAYGCILFEMLTAHRLFPAVTERDWERAHLESEPAALTSIVPKLPGEIDQFVRRCLAKDSAARPQSWDEIVAFFAEWYHRLTGKAVVLDFSSLALDAAEWLSASYSLSNLNRYEEAIEACDRALTIDPNVAATWNNRGNALLNLKRYAEAIEACDRALAIDQNYEPAWVTKGNALYNLKRYEEAIQAYDRALAIDQNFVFAWNNKGNALRNLKRYAEAIQACDRALAIDQNHVGAWDNKGIALRELNRYEEAIEACDRALAIDQNHVVAWVTKGNALYNLKRYEEAIQVYGRALAIDQNDAAAWSNKGAALRDLKRYEEAIQACDRALAINQNYVGAWNNKGNALYNLKRYEEAIQAYDRALAIDPNDAGTWNNKGNALYNLKRYEESVRAYDRALAIDANNAVALRGRNSAADALKAVRRPQSSWTRFWGK
jgi:tetratricopeptide (TPR) repeat protein